MLVKPGVFRFAALAAAGGMLLAGCSTPDTEQPDAVPTEDASYTASPSVPEVDLEQYAEALVTDVELMGVAQEPPVEGFLDEPVTMYLTLSEFSPTGQCAQLLDELNSYTGPAVAGVAAKFVRDVAADDDGAGAEQGTEPTEAAVETMIFETADPEEPMSIYREIPNACETLTSDEVEGAEATFTKVPGLDVVHLDISDGEDGESLAVGGSSVNGRFHMYMTAEQVSIEEAQEMFGAQAEKLQETFQDGATDAATDGATDAATDDATDAASGAPTDN